MSPNSNDIQAQLDAIRQAYYQSLPERLARIEHLWRELQQDSANDTGYEEFYRLIHGIAGSAETFGLPALTASARRLLQEIKRVPRPWRQGQLPPLAEEFTEFARIIGTVTEF